MFSAKFKDYGKTEINDANADDFGRFLRFLYTDEIELSLDYAADILHLADKYNVPLLFEQCIQYLTENITIENACTVFAVAKQHNSEDLKCSALEIICFHAKDCLTTEAFLQLSSDVVEDIARCEGLSCSEEILFESLDEWTGKQCKKNESDLTDENKREVLGNILFAVRFPLMKTEYIFSKISKRQICTEAEILQILSSHFAKREIDNLKTDDDHNVKFNNIARKSLKYESVKLSQDGDRLELTEISDELKNTIFLLDAAAWFYGIMIYGPKDTIRFCVEITLIDEDLKDVPAFPTETAPFQNFLK